MTTFDEHARAASGDHTGFDLTELVSRTGGLFTKFMVSSSRNLRARMQILCRTGHGAIRKAPDHQGFFTILKTGSPAEAEARPASCCWPCLLGGDAWR